MNKKLENYDSNRKPPPFIINVIISFSPSLGEKIKKVPFFFSISKNLFK